MKSARLMGGRKLKVSQVRDRVVVSGLPAQAPDPLDTVIELRVSGDVRQVLGAGCELLKGDPWRKTEK